MQRREFITILAGAAATWPLTARAQQQVRPVIGLLSSASSNDYAPMIAAFRKSLRETGYVEGQNVTIEYLWADEQYDRLPALDGRLGSSPSKSDCCGSYSVGIGGKARDQNNTDSLRDWRRPGADGTCRKPQQAQRQPHWRGPRKCRNRPEASRGIKLID